MRVLPGSLGGWGGVVDPEPQNREWALAAGGAALHGGYYSKSRYDAQKKLRSLRLRA
jgi:hypothetical protein